MFPVVSLLKRAIICLFMLVLAAASPARAASSVWASAPKPDFPKAPTAAVRDDAAGVVKVRHSVDANGKTTNVEVISEPAGSQTGDYLKKALPRLDFTPGYRNGRPTATAYTFTWWFGRVVGR